MFRVSLGLCAALSVACFFLWLNLSETKDALTTAKTNLATAEQTIKAQEKEIKATNETLAALEMGMKELRDERAADARAIGELLSQKENSEWGNSIVPESIRKFLLDKENPTKEGN